MSALSASRVVAPQDAFKRKFLIVLMVSGVIFTGLFQLAALGDIIPLSPQHFRANTAHMLAATLLTVALTRRPDWFPAIAWLEALNSFLIFLSALYNMPADEMRYVWFFVQAGGTFLLLGSAAGWATIGLTLAIVIASRFTGWIALSDNGIGTFSIGLPCAGVLFHAYNAQAERHIEGLRQANRRIEFVARHDALTGLFNRAAFDEFGRTLLAEAGKSGRPLSLLYADVDRFKAINDRFGHSGGDQALIAVAGSIEAAVRSTDPVARIGGEEIVVLLPDTDEAAAHATAERLRMAVEGARPDIGGGPLTVTVSVGWATLRAPEDDLDALMRRADEAMYRAKQAGRNRVEPASPLDAGLQDLQAALDKAGPLPNAAPPRLRA